MVDQAAGKETSGSANKPFYWHKYQSSLSAISQCSNTLKRDRMDTWHLLLHLSGCLGTRGTRSNDNPVSNITYQVVSVILHDLLNGLARIRIDE